MARNRGTPSPVLGFEQFILMLHASSTQTPGRRAQTPKPDPRAQSWNPCPGGARDQGPDPAAHEPGPQGGPDTLEPPSKLYSQPHLLGCQNRYQAPIPHPPIASTPSLCGQASTSRVSPVNIHVGLDSHHTHRMGGLLQAQPHSPLRGHPAPWLPTSSRPVSQVRSRAPGSQDEV